MRKIILASQSPRRKQLLEWAEIEFDVVVSDTDESFPAGLTMEETAIHIALEKARAVAKKIGRGNTILAADTIVVINDRIIGKPGNREEAISMLRTLSGQTHHVITGVALLADDKETSFADTTKVSFHSLSTDQVVYYVDHYKPYDKAGAYAIQEWIGVVGIKEITGDFYNVMGLPVSRVLQVLSNLS